VDLRRQTAVGSLDIAHTLEPQEVLDAHHIAPFDVRCQTFAVNIADPTEVSADGRGSRQGAGNSPRTSDVRSSDPVVSCRPSTVHIAERPAGACGQIAPLARGLGLRRKRIGDRLPIEYGQVVIQGPTAKRLWPSVVLGLIFFLGLLLEDNWDRAGR